MSLINTIIKSPVKAYQRVISPLFAPSCRFSPTCSNYMLEAIERHGAVKGVALGIWRILRCNPWHKCDHLDPVPERFDWGSVIGYKRGKLKKTPHKS